MKKIAMMMTPKGMPRTEPVPMKLTVLFMKFTLAARPLLPRELNRYMRPFTMLAMARVLMKEGKRSLVTSTALTAPKTAQRTRARMTPTNQGRPQPLMAVASTMLPKAPMAAWLRSMWPAISRQPAPMVRKLDTTRLLRMLRKTGQVRKLVFRIRAHTVKMTTMPMYSRIREKTLCCSSGLIFAS